MSTTAVTPQLTIEEKIIAAADQASNIVAMFSPVAAIAIKSGVAVEPMISGLVKLFAEIFKHHAKTATAK